MIGRRGFITGTAGAGVVLVVGATASARQGNGPYGPLVAEPDTNGLLLPEGFTSRVVARSGQPVGESGFEWLAFPDGAAVFPSDDSGWFHAVNSENPVAGDGGVSVLRYDAEGEVADAYRVLDGTQSNCAGGPTPWGTWLSCEEIDRGQVWECDVTGPGNGTPLPALGRFRHEAAAVDDVNEVLFLTEDEEDGAFYRFTPDAYPDLSAGLLELASVADDGAVTWIEVPDPSGGDTPTRQQVADVTPFDGGEGCWYADETVYFSTKGTDEVWALDLATDQLSVIYDGQGILTGVDNITVEAGSGDVYVAEDGTNMQLVVVTGDGEVVPVVQVVAEPLPATAAPSEITGPVFSPDGTRLYFSSQRGGDPQLGITYEVTGPFRGPELAAAAATTTTASPLTTIPAQDAAADDGGDDSSPAVPLAIGVGAAAAVVAGALAIRRRRSGP